VIGVEKNKIFNNMKKTLTELQELFYTHKHNRRVSSPPIKSNTEQGGDRFHPNQYGKLYDKYLTPYVSTNCVYVEVGILSGTGLAVVDKYLVDSQIYGFDIYTKNFYNNLDNLKAKGAFEKQEPSIHEFDCYNPDLSLVDNLFKSKKINFIVDDGHHTEKSITMAIETFLRYLDIKNFVYVIEDLGRLNIKSLVDKYGKMFGDIGVIDYFDKNIIIIKNK